MPWRNGGGTTFEVARAPERGEPFDWRVSFAEVNVPGPFSPFPGVDRIITLVSGGPMRLGLAARGAGEAAAYEPRQFEPFAFAGEDDVRATPRGPTAVLNVMTRRGRCAATVHILRSGQTSAWDEAFDETVLVACLAGHVAIGDGEELEPLDVATVRRAGCLRVDGVAALVRLTTV